MLTKSKPTPPLAAEVPHELEALGDKRHDPYYWLADRENPAVLAYLKAENEYAASVLKASGALQNELLSEMKSHIKENDESYPARRGKYLYWARREEGKEYSVLLRRLAGEKDLSKEQVILDENELARNHAYMLVSQSEVSDDENILAFSLDTKGDRISTIYFKDLRTGKLLAESIPETSGEFAWAADNKTIFYVKHESVTLRDRWVYRHRLGEAKDVLVYDEEDEKYSVGVHRSQSKRLIFIESKSKTTSETHYLDVAEPSSEFRLFQARIPEVLYHVDDGVDRFFIRTNDKAENFRLMECPLKSTDQKSWTEAVPYEPKIYFEDLVTFRSHLVVLERKEGLRQLRIIDRARGASRTIQFQEPDYDVTFGDNEEYEQDAVRFFFQSMRTPMTTIDADLRTGAQTIRRVTEVPGGFQSSDYVTERLSATADDGSKIPISIVYKKSLVKKSAETPLLLYAYGSYGHPVDSYFSSSRLALLDHGFVFAIAHIRGGSELGRAWYLDGKLGKKKNTFTDFIACAEHLIKLGWTSPAHLYAKGESAGGLLMGAVMNMRPELFHGVIAGVPFVDVLTTMLDATLPLTTGEYEEWGNPNEKESYDYIKSYSPYDNVLPGPYPHLLVRTGLNDSQVGFWEPAKWVAKLRKNKTDKNLILFETEMEAGHHGKNGRFSALEKIASEDVFLLELDKGRLG